MRIDEIIKMARQANLGVTLTHSGDVGQFIEGSNWTEEIEAFAKLVAAKEQKKWEAQTVVEIHEAVLEEREACAKVCEAQDEFGWGLYADAIRARGEA